MFMRLKIVMFLAMLQCFTVWSEENAVKLHGTIVDNVDRPIAQLKILARQVHPVVGYEQFEATTDEKGAFVFNGLYPESQYVLFPVVADSQAAPIMILAYEPGQVRVGFTKEGWLTGAKMVITTEKAGKESTLGAPVIVNMRPFTARTYKTFSRLPEPVALYFYVTAEAGMPKSLKNLERDVRRRLDDMKIVANGKLTYQIIHPTRSILKNLQEKDIQPFPVAEPGRVSSKNSMVYAALGVAYRDKSEKVVPIITPQNLADLECYIDRAITWQMREKKTVIALVTPQASDALPPHLQQMYKMMGKSLPSSENIYQMVEEYLPYAGYKVKKIDLTQEIPLPEKYDACVVLNPRQLHHKAKQALAHALYHGQKVFLAVQTYTFDYAVRQDGLAVVRNEEQPDVNDWLQKYGVMVDEDILMDASHVPLSLRGDRRVPFQTNVPLHILVTSENMNRTVPVISKLSTMLPYIWGNALLLDLPKFQEIRMQYTTLFSTTHKAWKKTKSEPITGPYMEAPPQGNQYPLMVMLEGQFPDVYPVETSDVQEHSKMQPQPGKLILLGCSTLFRNDFIRDGWYLLSDCLEFLLLEDDLGPK